VSTRGIERNLPSTDEAVILAAPHQNGLVDPVTIFATCKTRRITGVAAVFLFKMPIVGSVLRSLGVIPVTRPQDNQGTKTSNNSAIEAMASVLARRGALFIFPEGISHNNSIVLELKSGFARAAFLAMQSTPDLPRVSVVPVGLNYDAKNRFRSDVYVEYGSPLVLNRDEWLKKFEENSADTLHEITAIMRKKLQDVFISAPTVRIFTILLTFSLKCYELHTWQERSSCCQPLHRSHMSNTLVSQGNLSNISAKMTIPNSTMSFYIC
jgi:1-acyl-sn-glycerol-3-phosphate acyltransferase